MYIDLCRLGNGLDVSVIRLFGGEQGRVQLAFRWEGKEYHNIDQRRSPVERRAQCKSSQSRERIAEGEASANLTLILYLRHFFASIAESAR